MKKKSISMLLAILIFVQLMAMPAMATTSENGYDSINLSQTSVCMDWDADSATAITVTCGGTYRCEVTYVVSGDAASYDHAWLNCSVSGSTLTLSAKRPNYAAKERMARVTVSCGSARAVVVVTQKACEEDAPIVTLNNDIFLITYGFDIGNVPGVVTFQTSTKGIRKIYAQVTKIDGDTYTDYATAQISTGEAKTSAFTFSNLPAGNYRAVVYASNSDTSNDYWCQRKDKVFYFSVKEAHTHSYTFSGYEATHPHKAFEACTCGAVRYIGEEKKIFSCVNCNPATPVTSKDFSSFEEAEKMIRYSCTLDWSDVGVIDYVSQVWRYADDSESYFYVGADGYWNSSGEAAMRCTRAASAMALSYMGLTALPKHFNPTYCPYSPYAASFGCTTNGNDNETLGHTYSISLATFENWYELYHNDTVGKYSPIVLHSFYKGGYHAFAIFGRDANDKDYYYVIDSGSSDYIKRIKLVEVDGKIRIDEYRKRDGTLDYRYSSAYSMMGVWQYVNPNVKEAPIASVTNKN